ncbi:MAG: hypothetical protein M3Q06_07725, partial [Bacteroidota bacterium]|nr:hypothetical protein [Bacteroidota bacterium]
TRIGVLYAAMLPEMPSRIFFPAIIRYELEEIRKGFNSKDFIFQSKYVTPSKQRRRKREYLLNSLFLLLTSILFTN